MPPVTPVDSTHPSNETTYTPGEVYFRVTWADVKLLYPVIESFVYLGMNFSDEDLEDTWYFQSAIDFAYYGNALESFERPVSCTTKDQLADFVSAPKLILEIEEATSRRLAKKRHDRAVP
jgi:hypothetical protein